MNYCECGCGTEILSWNRFVCGHQRRGKVLSEETRQRISDARMGHITSEETKQKMSEANIGKEVSDETRQRMSEAHTGREISEEWRQRMSEAKIGQEISEEWRQKISKGLKLSIARDKILDTTDEATKESIIAGLYSRGLVE